MNSHAHASLRFTATAKYFSFLILLLVASLIALPGCSRKSKTPVISEPPRLGGPLRTGGSLDFVTKNNNVMNFTIEDSIDEIYMIFGVDEKPDKFSGGALYVLPIETAQYLQKQYNDIYSCYSEGKKAVGRHIKSILLYNSSPDAQTVMDVVHEKHHDAQRSRGDRICVRLIGHRLSYVDGIPGLIFDEHVHTFYPEFINIVPCPQ